jgi:hypothetical protein
MLRGLWDRLVNRREADRERKDAELAGMSPEERRFAEESVEDHAADAFVDEHLGGVDAGEPPRD